MCPSHPPAQKTTTPPTSRHTTLPIQLPAIIGHRGAAGTHPENTLPAFREARNARAHGVECDVRLTRDHRLAVVHDPDLQRLCGVPTSVARSTLDTVRKHPVTLGPNPSEHLPRIPELAEVLELPSPAAGPWLTLIEIKTPQPPEHPAPPVEPYLDALDEALTPLAGEPPPFRLMGFSETLLLAIKSARPHWPVLWLPRDTLTTTRILERWRHTALHTLDGIGHSHALGPAPQLRDCLPPGGKTLSVWTVNHPADARAYAHCGYDLLTTDFPRRLIEDGPHSGNPR